jgi:hypothetical protein
VRVARVDFAAFMKGVKLPEGWHWEVWNGQCITLMPPPSVDGHVTINTYRRLIALGFTDPIKTSESPTYRGRGWRQHLVNDAVAQLMGAQALLN